MMQQGITATFAHSRRTTDHDDRALFRVSAGHGIAETQSSHTVRHTDCADAVDASVTIGGVSSTGFVCGPDDSNGTFFQHAIKLQNKVARNPKEIANTVVLQSLN